MLFENVLNDIENLLVGKQLQSINPSTPPLFVTRIDREKDKYFIAASLTEKSTSRSINELRAIWDDLTRKGFANVDQSLYGGGSSRNQPETLFANLPYVQHFKFKNKKHIMLRRKPVHEPATLSEVQGADYRKIRKQVENYLQLNLPKVIEEQKDFLSSIYTAFDLVFKKYPGEATVQKVDSMLTELEKLNQTLLESVVTLDPYLTNKELSETFDLVHPVIISESVSLEDRLEEVSNTGVDEGNLKDLDLPNSFSVTMETDDQVKVPSNTTRIRQLTPVLSLIYDRIEFGDIELQPDFQRKDRIWKDDKRSKLIESILMRLPLPVFYFAEKSDRTWIVVDGLQRITSVYDFMHGDFPLKDLVALKQHNNKYFKDLTRTEQREIREYAITAYLIDVDSDKSNMIVELFHRINTYGVKLSAQEIRSALNQGSSIKFLRYLASTDNFKIATQNKVSPDRQKDMELILSALSFMVLGYQDYSTDNYDDFLGKAMRKLNKYKLGLENKELIDEGKSYITYDSNEYIKLYKDFDKAMCLAYRVFGEFAFVKDLNSRRSPISKQLFELVVSYFSKLNKNQENIVIEKSSVLIDVLSTAIEDNAMNFATWSSQTYKDANRGFRDAISTSTGKNVTVKYRFEAFGRILKESTGVDIDLNIIGKCNDFN